MKNSSRLDETIARNFSRSSSGTVRVLGELQHPVVELHPRELAVEVEAGILEIRAGGDSGGLVTSVTLRIIASPVEDS